MGQDTSSHKNVKYVVDETVVLEGDDRAYHVWDLEQDPSKEDKFRINAISRDGVPIRTYLLPQEELSHFTAGDNVWWEHRGEPGIKLDETVTVSERDSEPFVHHGDYALVITTAPEASESSSDSSDGGDCKTPEVTLKLREREET